MSGPKGGSYEVVDTAAQRRARELQQAREEEVRAVSTWRATAARVAASRKAHGQVIDAMPSPPPSAAADAAAVRARAAALTSGARQVRERLDQQVKTAAASALHRHLEDTGLLTTIALTPAPVASAPAARNAAPVTAAVPPAKDADVAARVRRQLEHLPPDADPGDVDRAVNLAAQVDQATSQWRAELLLDALEKAVDRAVARTAEAQRVADREHAVAAELTVLLNRLAGVDGATATELRATIIRASKDRLQEVPFGLVDAVSSVLQLARAEADQRLVARLMRDGLAELGYRLGPEFDAELHTSGVAFAGAPGSAYGVKIRLEQGTARFSAQVVKPDDRARSHQEDETAEQTFCTDFTALVDYTRAHGLHTDVNIRVAAGAVDVQQVPATHIPTVGGTVTQHISAQQGQVRR